MATTGPKQRPKKKPRVRVESKGSAAPSRRSVGIALAVAVMGAAALIVVAVALQKNRSPAPVNAPVANFAGIPQSGRTVGFKNAKVELIEFADPQCPGCRYYALNILPKLVDEYVRPGKIKMQYHVYPFIGNDSIKAARFVIAAGFQGKLWQLHEALYRHQGAENSGWVTDSLVRQLAGEIPGLDVEKLFTDASSARVTAMIGADIARVRALKLSQTPSILLKTGNAPPYLLSVPLDVAAFRQALDGALRG